MQNQYKIKHIQVAYNVITIGISIFIFNGVDRDVIANNMWELSPSCLKRSWKSSQRSGVLRALPVWRPYKKGFIVPEMIGHHLD